MAVTVRGTDIVFNDGTTQSTANNLPANTTNVLNATAGASAGAVGTYGLMWQPFTTSSYAPGQTIAGSYLRFASCSGSVSGAPGTGTWRCMGQASPGETSAGQTTLWLRIS